MSDRQRTERHAKRSFEDRFGAAIVSKGIATFPSIVLRWQAALGLDNGQLVTLLHVFSYYREGRRWPSVSINAIAVARDVSRALVEREIAELEAKGFISRAGVDPRYHTFHFALSGLFSRLQELVDVEQRLAELRSEQARLRRAFGTGRKTGKESEREDEIENTHNLQNQVEANNG